MMKSAKDAFFLTGIMFLCIGLVFLGISFGFFKSNEHLMETGVSAPGVYSRVTGRNVWFAYEAEGKVWERRSSVSSFTMHEGDPVTVWYPVGQPDQGRITTWETWGVFLIVGGVFSLLGSGFLGAVLLGQMKKRSLMMNGTQVVAKVTQISQNPYVRFNRRNPWVVHAVCVHPYTGQEMKVKSGMFMEDPRPLIPNGEVEVLVDPMREKRYFVKIGE